MTLAAVMTALALAADFPAPEQLPARPDLPDPLVTLAGERVTTKEQWFDQRRPELKALFAHYMYGPLPKPTAVSGTVVLEDKAFLGGTATLRDIDLTVGPAGAPKLHLLVVTPNGRGPVPVFAGLNFQGNHAVTDHPGVRLPAGWMRDGKDQTVVKNRATEAGRGKQADVWNADLVVARGYGLATVYYGDIDPDRKEERGGVRPSLNADDSGCIAAWAWGLSRVVDFLSADPAVDARRIAVVGHSRLGKTALLAAAFDDRVALAVPSQAGCGGTAPSRGKVGESVAKINAGFPHWFNANFKRFNAAPEKLPFDQNALVALVAPRPVLFCNAQEDAWANPAGQFDVLKAADGVYRFLGAGGLEAKEVPPLGRLSAGTLGYFVRPGKHSMTRQDWGAYLDFADKHLRK